MSNQDPKAVQAINAAEFEVMGVLGAEFLDLAEVAPGQEWEDVLAAGWGIPVTQAAAVKQTRPTMCKHAMKALFHKCFRWSLVLFGGLGTGASAGFVGSMPVSVYCADWLKTACQMNRQADDLVVKD
jgi:hypothetical protein